jgi:hypothetical protein
MHECASFKEIAASCGADAADLLLVRFDASFDYLGDAGKPFVGSTV